MDMNLSKLSVLGITVGLCIAGCAADASQDETSATTSEELTVTRLKGHWSSSTGPIYSIDFTTKNAKTLGGFVSGHEFTAQIDNGVRCITTPCPNVSTVTGVYKSSGGKLTLASYDKPAWDFSRIIGDYTHALSDADGTLTVDKSDNTIHETLTRSIPCGNTSCAPGLYCCNALRSMCAKPGVMCIQ
jgi:hypothetical protein